MRIVYDDTMQADFVETLEDFLFKFTENLSELKSIVEYDYGMERVQGHLFKKKLNEYLADFEYEVGNSVVHAYGIGNNCCHPVHCKEYPDLRKYLWRGQLWNGSYFCETIGSVSEENVLRYIERQNNCQL